MPGRTWRRAALLALALHAGAVGAAGEIDRRFGREGMLSLGFQAVEGETADVGVVACARPDGSLYAVGFASGAYRIVSAWFTERGALDMRYGGDGKESTPVGPDVAFDARGLCLPSGDVLIVAEMVAPDFEGRIQVWRFDGATGRPDPAFGVAGLRVLDLDDYAADLAKYESPRSLTLGRNGDLLIGGEYSLGSNDDRRGGFLARLDAQGTVRAVSLAHQWDASWDILGPSGVAADGTLWSAALRDDPAAPPVKAALLRFDYDTLTYRDTLHAQISVDLTPGHAVMLDGATMALAGVRQSGKPLVALLRADSIQVLQPPLPQGYALAGKVQVAGLPGNRLMFAASAKDGQANPLSMAFARLRILTDGSLQPDPTFGDGGALGSAFPPPPACAGIDSAEIFHRFTYWKGRPTAIGTVDVACPGAAPEYDWMLLRLDMDRVFSDGFGASD